MRDLLVKPRVLLYLVCVCASVAQLLAAHGHFAEGQDAADTSGRPILIATINGPINPATDDYLRTSVQKAADRHAALLIIKLNTPGGLLTSMQTMVETLLESPVPTVVYVSPGGGGAMSAGTFLTLAGNFAVMAPGTTIGAAHPVLSSGGDVQGDMGAKVENFAVSLIRAIAEQRGRNAKWAEQAVRESVAITDRDAVREGVIDFVAADIDSLLEQLEGRTAQVNKQPVTLTGLRNAARTPVDMNLKQQTVNVLADPNIAILLGLGALLGIGIEFYHPGAIFPGIVGVVCLILSLTAGQVLPISYGGVALLLLGAGFFVVELFLPAFGIWGVAGIVCFVLGSIYFVDTDQVWAESGFSVDRVLIGSVATVVGGLLMALCYLALRSGKQAVTTGPNRLVGLEGVVASDFKFKGSEGDTIADGKIRIAGEIWNARLETAGKSEDVELPKQGERLVVISVTGLFAEVKRAN